MKSQFLKLCSMVLIFALLLNLFPAQAIALELDGTEMGSTSEGTTSEKISTEKYNAESATIVAEIPEKRTAFTKDYKLSNGFNMSVVYPEVVHYEDEGQWKEIDNTLKATGSGIDGVYTNTSGGWNAIFPQQLTKNNRVSVVKGAYTVSFGMAGELRSDHELMSEDDQVARTMITTEEMAVTQMQTASAQIIESTSSADLAELEHPDIVREKLYSRLSYEDVYSNVDIIYDLNGYQLKESIVIKSYDSSLRGYQYVLETGMLTPVLNDDGSIDLFAPETEEAIMQMPAPYMVDSAGAVSYDVGISLVPQNGSYLLTYSVPTSWMADSSRVWPVVLDPAVIANPHYENILDASVMERNQTPYTSGALLCGYNMKDTERFRRVRSYIQYKELPKLNSADVIVNASLSLLCYQKSSETPLVVEAHKVFKTWDSKYITWDTQPAFDAKIEDFALVGAEGRYSWDITDIAREWYANSNTGVMLKAPDTVENAEINNWKKFYSIDFSSESSSSSIWPRLQIVYRNTNGLESYWDYTTTSAGRAGTGYVNNYSGNLTWVHGDIGFGGNRMPVSISHIYNSSEAQTNAFGLGYGWRTNYNQTVSIANIVDDGNNKLSTNAVYVWTDGDGTNHYFISKDNEYVDEDGLELKLTVTSTGYTITDKDGNRSNFDINGRLISMVNNQEDESKIEISYTDSTGLRISKITDGATRFYHFSYNSEELLEKISYTGKGASEISRVTYTYINSRLVAITDKDSESSTFTYGTNGLLETVTDVDGYKVGFFYNTVQTVGNEKKPIRVIRVQEWDDSAEGRFLTIDYTQNQTTLTDHNTNTHIIQFNDWGNVVSVQDNQGRAEFAQYARVKYGETEGKANQLTLSSKMQNTVGNMLKDSSFENGTLWNVSSSAVTRAISTEAAYHGSKSLKLARAANGNGAGVYSSYFTLEGGETCTFSAYVKTGGGSVYLVLSDDTTPIISQTLAANSDWTRMEVSFTNTTTTSKRLRAWMMTTKAGVTYMDCAQVEVACAPSRYNLIENGDFRYSGSPAYGWTSSGLSATDTLITNIVNDHPESAAPELDATVLKITGNPTSAKTLSQTLNISGSKGDCYVLGGWAKGDSVPLGEVNGVKRGFGLKLTFNYTEETNGSPVVDVSFNCDLPSNGNWQYAATPAVAKAAYSSITVELVYSYNANEVYFDGIQLFKEQFGSSYTYDTNGNVTNVVDLQKQETTYEYNANGDLAEIIQNDKAKMTYTYYQNSHNVETATTGTGVVYKFTYDTYGNNTSVSIVSGDTEITSSAEYSADGNRLESTTDALDKTTTYGYNENTNVLEWVQYPNDTEATRTEYSYDSMCRLISASVLVSPGGNTLSASYTYTDDLLTRIQTNSTAYNFTYGPFSQRTGVSVGTQTLATYEYTGDRNRYLQKMTYGNEDFVQYTYDSQGRVICETYEDGSTVTYAYDNSGALATVTDSETGITARYYYDLTDRLVKYTEKGNSYSHEVKYTYDEKNNLVSMYEVSNTRPHPFSYTYDDSNRLTKLTYGAGGKTYTYDAYGRLTQRGSVYFADTVIRENITYKTSSSAAPSSQVATWQNVSNQYDVTYSYTYDGNGNILSVSDGTNTTSYVYDSANQLIRENNQAGGFTHVWAYDYAGNITSRTEYAYTTGSLGTPTDTIAYTYGDSDWGDLLMAYDGVAIEHDDAGNPTNDGTWTYTWKHGRQLASMTDGTTTVSYTYNADGMRIGKTVTRANYSETHTYFYNNGHLTYDIITIVDNGTTINHNLLMSYDESGRPLIVTYDHTSYYYLLNLQGDVVGIMNMSGELMVGYTYDAWGNVLSVTGPMASTMGYWNQYRYRGYVYDQETTLYYLQSRYYNPAMGRFISADDYPTTGQGLTGNNMFAYCGNNPTSRADQSGKFWNYVIGAVVGGVVSAVTTAVQSYKETGEVNWQSTIIAGVVGAVGGAVAASGLNFLVQAGITMAATAAGDVLTQKVESYTTGAKYNPMRTIHNTLLAGGCSILGSGLGSLASYGQTALGSELLEKGAEKAGQAFCRSNLGLSSSKLVQQAEKLIRQGNVLTNIGRGISSVTGTLLTWGVSVEYSY